MGGLCREWVWGVFGGGTAEGCYDKLVLCQRGRYVIVYIGVTQPPPRCVYDILCDVIMA